MATLYPNGYSGSPAGTGDMRTLEGCATRTTIQRLHPEMWKRVSAMMTYAASQGVMLGVGTGWRVQPSGRPGFAEPGNSYHEGFMPNGISRPNGVDDSNALACDMVIDSSWNWMGANCAKFGLVDFSDVNNEPWHVQPAEIPRSRNFATRIPPLHDLSFQVGTPGEVLIVTPQDDAAIREIIREQTLANCRAQTAAAVSKFQALVNAQPTNAIYKAALAQEQARLVEYDARIASLKVLGEVDTLEESAAAIQAGLAKLTVAELTTALTPAVTNAVNAALEAANIEVDINYEAVAESVANELKERLVD